MQLLFAFESQLLPPFTNFWTRSYWIDCEFCWLLEALSRMVLIAASRLNSEPCMGLEGRREEKFAEEDS